MNTLAIAALVFAAAPQDPKPSPVARKLVADCQAFYKALPAFRAKSVTTMKLEGLPGGVQNFDFEIPEVEVDMVVAGVDRFAFRNKDATIVCDGKHLTQWFKSTEAAERKPAGASPSTTMLGLGEMRVPPGTAMILRLLRGELLGENQKVTLHGTAKVGDTKCHHVKLADGRELWIQAGSQPWVLRCMAKQVDVGDDTPVFLPRTDTVFSELAMHPGKETFDTNPPKGYRLVDDLMADLMEKAEAGELFQDLEIEEVVEDIEIEIMPVGKLGDEPGKGVQVKAVNGEPILQDVEIEDVEESPVSEAAPITGRRAPEVRLSDGKAEKPLSLWRGRVVVLVFFEADVDKAIDLERRSALIKLQKACKPYGDKVVFHAINNDADEKQLAKWRKATAYQGLITHDPKQKRAEAFGVETSNHIVVIDRDGITTDELSLDCDPDTLGELRSTLDLRTKKQKPPTDGEARIEKADNRGRRVGGSKQRYPLTNNGGK